MKFRKISNELIYSTICIKCELNDGSSSTGTGFFFELERTEEGSLTLIITNKHVIEDSIIGYLDILTCDENDDESVKTYAIYDFEEKWIMHPDDDTDLCALVLGEHIDEDELSKEKLRLFYNPITLDYLPTEQDYETFGAIEDVIMIGYPNGIMDEINMKPIVRRGITATHPNIDYEDTEEFLIDIACFEGSSGSPVFIFNQGSFIGSDGQIKLGTQILFIGIMYAGFDKSQEGELVKTPIKDLKIPVIKIPLNLAIAIKSKKILDFKDLIFVNSSKQMS